MKHETNMDYGLMILYDGNRYELIFEGDTKEYPVGGLICEYCRIAPADLKDIILRCTCLDKAANEENIAIALEEFYKNLIKQYYPVQASMIFLDFFNHAKDWIIAMRDGITDDLLAEINELADNGEIKKYILQGTSFTSFGSENILQFLLTCYLRFSVMYVHIKYLFDNLVISKELDNSGVQKSVDFVVNMYGEDMEMQKIDYRIVNISGAFRSLYTVKSPLSLFLFELAHCLETTLPPHFVKCSNCGCFFVPEGRCDAVYCNYASPQDPSRSCRKIGAQRARANKEKNDIVTKEYRKVYMRYKMKIKRHPYDDTYYSLYKQLTSEIKEWRIALTHGTKTIEEFLIWLNAFN